MRRRWRILVVLITTLLALGAPAPAMAACPKTSVADVEDEVMCPVCGTPLALATEAPQAQRERAFIFELVQQCRSKEEIKIALVAEFGDDVLGTPDAEGFDLAAYLVPALALLGGALGVAFAALRWRRARGDAVAAGAGSVPLDPQDSARLEADMRRYDL